MTNSFISFITPQPLAQIGFHGVNRWQWQLLKPMPVRAAVIKPLG